MLLWCVVIVAVVAGWLGPLLKRRRQQLERDDWSQVSDDAIDETRQRLQKILMGRCRDHDAKLRAAIDETRQRNGDHARQAAELRKILSRRQAVAVLQRRMEAAVSMTTDDLIGR